MMTHWIQRKPQSPELCQPLPTTRISAFLHSLPSNKHSAFSLLENTFSIHSETESLYSQPSEQIFDFDDHSEGCSHIPLSFTDSRPGSPSSSRYGLTDCDEDSEMDDSDWEDDAHAQYITIPPDSPYWKAPRNPYSSFLSPPSTTYDRSSPKDTSPSSSSLAARISEQTTLIHMFHAELRRMMPSDGSDVEGGISSFEFDECLEQMDAELLLAPTNAFEGVCLEADHAGGDINWDVPSCAWSPWSETSSHRLPDVPLDLEESDDESIEGWIMERPSCSRDYLACC